jgi:predicted dehydrogenase
MTPLGLGLIGLGRHGSRYAAHLLDGIPNVRLAAVARRNEADGRAFAARHGLRYHRTYQELIGDPAVEAVIVVTLPSVTPAICLDAVAAKKPVLIEKPLACTGAAARGMVRAAEAAGVTLMTAHTLRFDPAVQALKADLGKVGVREYLCLTSRVEPRPDLSEDRADYGGRGVLLEIGIHLLDLIRFLTGEEAAEVRCEMRPEGRAGPESMAVATVTTAGGFPCLVETSRLSESRVGRAEWIGRNGQVSADWMKHRTWMLTGRDIAQDRTFPDRPTIVSVLEAFVGSVMRGVPPPVTGLDGLRAVEIADACYHSALTGRWATVRNA